MKSTAKMNNAQLNNELSSEEIIAIGKKAYEEATAITWRQAEVGRTLTQNDKIALVDDKTLVIGADVGTGQVPQYYVEQDHAFIIPPETFRRVQDELERRKDGHPTGRTIFSGRIYCGECGQIYGSKVWHSNDPYRKVVWQCIDKFKTHAPAGEKRKCTTPTLTEEKIRTAFEEVLRKLGSGRKKSLLTFGACSEGSAARSWKRRRRRWRRGEIRLRISFRAEEPLWIRNRT